MRIAALSDMGLVRTKNEDAYWYDPDRGIFVLADGLGGHRAGEVAAGLAVKVTADRLSIAIDNGLDGDDLARALQDAFSVASHEIYSLAKGSPNLTGMGCSLIAAILKESECFVAHVGDSRAYLLCENQLLQMTVDDTPVAAMVKRGYLLPEKAGSHALKNMLVKTVGTKASTDANVSQFPVKHSEKLLFCSDGLWGLVDKKKIQNILEANEDLEKACLELITAARGKGGRDNITVILVEQEGN